MPNLDNIRKWAEALESGEYQQAKGYLAIVGSDGTKSYCCLGVACEVAIKNGVPLAVMQVEGDGGEQVLRYDDVNGVLPVVVSAWLGIKVVCPRLNEVLATDMNDNQGFTLAQIGARVREHYLAYA